MQNCVDHEIGSRLGSADGMVGHRVHVEEEEEKHRSHEDDDRAIYAFQKRKLEEAVRKWSRELELEMGKPVFFEVREIAPRGEGHASNKTLRIICTLCEETHNYGTAFVYHGSISYLKANLKNHVRRTKMHEESERLHSFW